MAWLGIERKSWYCNVCQNGAADCIRYQHGVGSFWFERRRAKNTIQAQQREIDRLCCSVTGPFQFEAILKVRAEFGKDGRLRGSTEVPGHNNGQVSMLGPYLPQSVKQVLKLFTVNGPEGVEIFPAGGGVQVEAVFKGIQTEVDEPDRQRGIFRYPVYDQPGCVRDALGRANLPVSYDDGATAYLFDVRGTSKDAVGEFKRSVVVAASLDEDDVCTEFGYLFNGRVFFTTLVQGENSDLPGIRSWWHFVILHSGSGNGREKVCDDDAIPKPDDDAKQTDPGTESQPCNECRKGEDEAARANRQCRYESHCVRSGPEDGDDDDPQAQGNTTQCYSQVVNPG